MAEKKLFGRGGFTANATTGEQKTLGYWPEELTGPNAGTYVNACFKEFSDTLRMAQKYHEQNQSVMEAKAANRVPELLDPLVRQKLAREDQKRIAAMRAKIDRIDGDLYDQHLKLRACDYSDDPGSVLKRSEVRAALKTMSPEQRASALKDFLYRSAALEQPAELSGMTPAQHKMLHDQTVAARYPDDLANIRRAEEAVAIVKRCLSSTETAVENELKSVGAGVKEPEPKPEPKPWIPT